MYVNCNQKITEEKKKKKVQQIMTSKTKMKKCGGKNHKEEKRKEYNKENTHKNPHILHQLMPQPIHSDHN